MGALSDGIETVGGSAPNYLLPVGSTLYACNGNNDTVDALSLARWGVQAPHAHYAVAINGQAARVGLAGMAASPDGRRLYVAESGLNAIAVLDTRLGTVLGHIPTAWYPYRVALSPDGRKLACISFRGFGNGPNAGKNIPQSAFLHMAGALTVLDTPVDGDLQKLTRTVLECTGLVDRSEDRAALTRRSSRPRRARLPSRSSTSSSSPRRTTPTIPSSTAYPARTHDPSLLRWGLPPDHHEARASRTLEDVARDDQPQRAGAAIHRERQLLYGA